MPTYITASTANTEGFIPTIWAQEALPILRNNINLAKFVAKDSDFGEGAFATVGQTLTVGYAGTFATQAKTANTLLTASVPSNGSSVSVTLNNYQVVPFVVENIAQAQSNQNLMQRLLEPAITALAEKVETDLFTLANSFSPVSYGTIGTDMTSAVVRGAQKQLNINKAPVNDRYLVMSPKDLAALEADSTLANYFNFNPQNGVVENGSFGRSLYGFTPVMSQLVPTLNSGTTAHSVQTLTAGTQTGGTFTLTYGGQTTSALAWNASAAAIEAALQALSSVGTGMARVSGAQGTSAVSTVVIYLASPTAITAGTGSLTGGSPAMTIADAASTTIATSNIALHKNAMLLASRPVRPAGGTTVSFASIYDDVSGLTLNLEAQYNVQAMGLWVNASILYGTVALRPDQGVVVLA